MKSVIKLIGTIFGVVTFGQVSHGSLVLEKPVVGELDILQANSICAELVSLNEKEGLDDREWSRGHLLNNLIEQVSDSPIEYCSYTLARSTIADGEGTGEN